MHSSIPVHPLTRIPPPLMFAVTFLLGAGMQLLIPLYLQTAWLIESMQLLGGLLLSFGILCAAICIRLFVKFHTTLIPFAVSDALVTRGPYRFTRNPMYVSLTAAYLGVAGVTTLLWPIFFLPLPLLLLQRFVIPGEEARLRERFGAQFSDYVSHVRRWL